MKLVKDIENKQDLKEISDKEAEEAFKTILYMQDVYLNLKYRHQQNLVSF